MAQISGALAERGRLSGSLSAVGGLTGTLSSPEGLTGQLTVPQRIAPDYFDGPYEITPSESAQRLETTELLMRGDVVVGAIPQNYGRLSWDGRTLTVY